MRYLYTQKPDEGCHEVAPGVFGRPAHTGEIKKLLAAGWKNQPQDFANNKTLEMPKKQDK